jgi:hypothetical protein
VNTRGNPRASGKNNKGTDDDELEWRHRTLSDCVAGGVGMPLTHLFDMVAMTSTEIAQGGGSCLVEAVCGR